MVPGIVMLALAGLACTAARKPAATPATAPRIVFDRTSSFGRVLVIDEGARRVMRFGSPSASDQSAIEPGNLRAVPVEYVRYALLGLAHHGRPRRVLMVGLGGGTFTTLVHRALPDTMIDAIEIDPVVVDAARAHFGLREDERYRVHVADAVDWIGRGQSGLDTYDFVLLDAYAGEGIPPALGTPAFFRAVAGRLAPGGVVAINIAEMQAEGRAVARAFAAVLRPFECLQTPVDGNVLLFASDGAHPVDAEAMARWVADWDARGVTDFSLASLAEHRTRAPACAALGLVSDRASARRQPR
jgi:spermidine synthase